MSKKSFDPKDQKSASGAVQFDSGLNQSLQNLALDADGERKARDLAGGAAQPARRWQIQYSELKFGASKGNGAYGEVFEGQYRKSKVAIKVYDFRGQLLEKQQAEILHEADLMESLRSEYLVGFRGICFDPRYCLVMEYCEGGTLRGRLDKLAEIPLPEQLRWAMQISYGVYQLHSVRIVHRDLKAENILLDGHSHAKVADFGLSLVKSSSASQSKKGGGAVAGTLPWMAPELFKRKPQSSAADVYSLGMVLWEMMSRRRPFEDMMPGVIAGMVSTGEREIIDEAWPLVFRTLMQACWDAEPSKRPTAEKVGEELESALKSLESAPKVASKSAEELELEQLKERLRQSELEKQRWQEESEKLKRQQSELTWREEAKKPPKKQQRKPAESASPPAAQNPSSFLSPPKPAVKAADTKEVGKLLKFVAEGEQDQAEAMIKQKPELLLTPGKVTDLSGRTFKKVTGFQYALWSMDYHMWTMIKKYLPVEAQAEQLKDLESKGMEHGKHYDLKPLMDALQKYVDNYAEWSYEQCQEHWSKVVGGVQKTLPAHVVNEYARPDRAFEPCPSEWELKLPRSREVQVCECSQFFKGSWFSTKQVLGSSFAFYRYRNVGVIGESAGWRRGGVHLWLSGVDGPECVADLKALQSLWKTRTQQLELLVRQLSAPSLGAESASGKVEPSQLAEAAGGNPFSILPPPKPAMKAADAKEVAKLLKFVAEGEQDQAEVMIKQNPSLLLTPGEVKDLSGRTFKKVTGFQYALWSMDYHMWTMIKKYLPVEVQAEQLKDLESKGMEHGKHYDLKPLTDALQKYIDNYDKWSDEQCQEHWCKEVGGVQKTLPAHVVNEYVRPDRAFEPCPSEWELKLPRSREVQVHDGSQSVKGSWFIAPSAKDSLGASFAFYRSVVAGVGVAGQSIGGGFARYADLKALQSLWKTRTQQLELLRSELSSAAHQSQRLGLG